mmetsp:Transcript_2011/g.3096  ORF Transcript_2011/g.3096 Transcript_2011/m.3096 type:complete len:83 (+) Transcript_2011:3893-4141(+)
MKHMYWKDWGLSKYRTCNKEHLPSFPPKERENQLLPSFRVSFRIPNNLAVTSFVGMFNSTSIVCTMDIRLQKKSASFPPYQR